MSSWFGVGEVLEISCNSPSIRDGKRIVPLAVKFPGLESMIGRDRSSVSSEPAFFKDSMRRDAIIGRITVLALWNTTRR